MEFFDVNVIMIRCLELRWWVHMEWMLLNEIINKKFNSRPTPFVFWFQKIDLRQHAMWW